MSSHQLHTSDAVRQRESLATDMISSQSNIAQVSFLPIGRLVGSISYRLREPGQPSPERHSCFWKRLVKMVSHPPTSLCIRLPAIYSFRLGGVARAAQSIAYATQRDSSNAIRQNTTGSSPLPRFLSIELCNKRFRAMPRFG